MTAHEVKVWSVTPGLLSEGPRWHEERQELLWVDILGRQMHRGTLGPDGALERVETISIDRHIGAAAPAAGGGYVLAAGAGFLFVDEAGSIQELAQPEGDRTDVRMNDGACDPQGRFWAGTMAYDESPGAGTLYRLELDGSCTTVLTGLTISNGIGWSPDASTMYLNDSGTGCVDVFRFDGPSGAISDRRTLVHIDQPGVAPDGLTVDDEGGIWVALWNGAAIHRYAPDGSLLASVQLPVERPTSCAFGGPRRDTLFVTTARQASTMTRWPASRTQAKCSPSTGSAPAASLACRTAAGHHGHLNVRARWRAVPLRLRAHRLSGTDQANSVPWQHPEAGVPGCQCRLGQASPDLCEPHRNPMSPRLGDRPPRTPPKSVSGRPSASSDLASSTS